MAQKKKKQTKIKAKKKLWFKIVAPQIFNSKEIDFYKVIISEINDKYKAINSNQLISIDVNSHQLILLSIKKNFLCPADHQGLQGQARRLRQHRGDCSDSTRPEPPDSQRTTKTARSKSFKRGHKQTYTPPRIYIPYRLVLAPISNSSLTHIAAYFGQVNQKQPPISISGL